MNKILGEINNGQYSLTIDGKKELVDEIYRRRFYQQEKNYNDNNFLSILEFVFRNFDNTVEKTLGENVKQNQIPLDRHVRISENRKRLETWFESVACSCNREDLTGDDILSFFCSDEYQSGISEHGFVSTIDGITEILRRNIGLENTEFLNKIKSSNSRPIRK